MCYYNKAYGVLTIYAAIATTTTTTTFILPNILKHNYS